MLPHQSSSSSSSERRRSFAQEQDLEIPDEFKCPITREIMSDPVVLESGHSYEREAIQAWFNTGKKTDPKTNLRLSVRTHFPNIQLRQAIERFLQERPILLKAQQEQQDHAEAIRLFLEQQAALEAKQSSRDSIAPILRFNQAPSHQELMQHLARSLDVDFNEVYVGSLVEQTFIEMLGIQENQSHASYRFNGPGTTRFVLCFNRPENFQQFMSACQNRFRGLIKGNPEQAGSNRWKIVVDTLIFVNEVIPAMVAHHRRVG